jgi:hypothetical protein
VNVWTYVITVDAGAAPNFDLGLTTLTVCKPRIRKSAKRGDLVLAFNGKRLNPNEPHSIRWAGVVIESIPLKEYWADGRFEGKKPGQSHKPDNIYRPTRSGELKQVANSTHRPEDYSRDVSGENALVLNPSWYFGPDVALLPETFNLRMIGGRRGHRCSPIDSRTWRKLESWLKRTAPTARPARTVTSTNIHC